MSINRQPIDCPWPHVGPGTHPNLPTPEGRELGVCLATFAEQEFAAHPDLPPMCADCAFRRGSDANGSPATLMSALKSLLEFTPFYCHHPGPNGEEPLCAGYRALLAAQVRVERGWLERRCADGGVWAERPRP